MVVNVEASIAPVVYPSSVFKSDAATVVSDIVTASSPPPLIPAVAYIVLASATDPVIVVTVLASTVPVVFALRVLRVDAATDVSVNVTASSPNPVIPAEA